MLYGPDGSGKYARAILMLCEIFNDRQSSIRNGIARAIDPESGSFVAIPGTGGSKKTQKAIYVFTSQVHCEIDIQQSNAEKALIPFLEYYSKTKNVFLKCHKYILIRHANRISHRTQNSLRKLMESKLNSVRFIITSKSLVAWTEPLQSRFLSLSISSPTPKEALSILRKVSSKEKWSLTPSREKKILELSKYGEAGCLNLIEMLMVAEGSFMITTGRTFKTYTPDRIKATEALYNEMKNGDKEKIRDVIEKIAVTMADHLNMIITGELPRLILRNCPENKKHECVEISAYWNHRLADDTIFYPILTVEAYIFSMCELMDW
jgi:DNA polymerase III delta prime subunit